MFQNCDLKHTYIKLWPYTEFCTQLTQDKKYGIVCVFLIFFFFLFGQDNVLLWCSLKSSLMLLWVWILGMTNKFTQPRCYQLAPSDDWWTKRSWKPHSSVTSNFWTKFCRFWCLQCDSQHGCCCDCRIAETQQYFVSFSDQLISWEPHPSLSITALYKTFGQEKTCID